MPFLPLDQKGSYARTLGIMLFPGPDEEQRKKADAVASATLAGANSLAEAAKFEFGGDVFRMIVALSGGKLVAPEEVERQNRKGVLVGELVKCYFWLMRQKPSLASWENATKILEKYENSSSRSTRKQYKREMLPAAHLWGAWCLRDCRLVEQPEVGYTRHDDFHTFLDEAEHLLAWGTEWRQKRAKAEPPFPVESMWRVPTGWTRERWNPEWKVPDHLEYDLEDELIADLNPPGRKRRST